MAKNKKVLPPCRTSATLSPANRSAAWRASCGANAQAGFENVPLWHERDISHSSVERIILPDSTTLIDYLLHKTTNLIETMFVYP